MDTQEKIIFVHVPKTAGQSIRHVLETHFGSANCAPVLVNEQWAQYDSAELSRYTFFSGHHDLDHFDTIPGKKRFFTILRDPMDRIASFYYFLRKQAAALPQEELNKPERTGLRLAHNYSIDEYFGNNKLEGRAFIDAHFDNFYMFYFASGRYFGRNYLRTKFGDTEESRKMLCDQAGNRLADFDLVGHVESMDEFQRSFESVFGISADFVGTRLNTTHLENGRDKANVLLNSSMKDETRQRLKDFAREDYLLLDQLFNRNKIAATV